MAFALKKTFVLLGYLKVLSQSQRPTCWEYDHDES